VQRVVTLLYNDREMDGYARSVSGQGLSTHVPAATVTRAMEETACLFVVRAEML
jgi:hypothetical protein